MTSAPVNGVGSLLNFVGNRAAQTVNMGAAAGSFGDVMSKTSGSQTDSGTMDKMDYAKDTQTAKLNSSYTNKEISKAENGKETVRTVKADGKQKEALTKAGEKLVKEVADKLGVSEEEVIDAMEELGFGVIALSDVDNLTQLALTLSGEDSLALLTNEGLYGTVQELLQSLKEIQAGLAEEMGMKQEELTQLIENSIAAEQMPEEALITDENPVMLNQQETGAVKQTKITVTVEQGEDNIKFSADENGNVKQVETVVSKENSKSSEQSSQGNPNQESMQDGLGTGNPILDNLLQNKLQAAEEPFEQTAFSMTPETNEIMDQILEHMKIQLKPGMDQLEMQLHPESLGSLHIQLTSKSGEVTAQFRVQNEEVKAAIESQIVELKESLKEQGIKVEAVEVAVESHAFESNLWQGQGKEENESYQNSRKATRRVNLNDLEEGFEEMNEEEEMAAKMMRANGNTVDYTA